jgi:hypothetical protein
LYGSSTSLLNVNIAGNDYGFSQTQSSSNYNLLWGQKSFSFIANNTTSTLTFSSLDGSGYWGPLLDDISVECKEAPVPEPTSAILGIISIAGALGLRRNKKA